MALRTCHAQSMCASPVRMHVFDCFQSASDALELSAEAQHRCYPTAAMTVHRAAMSVTATMRNKLLDSEALHAVCGHALILL